MVDVTKLVESFFDKVRTTRALGAGTPETSYYEALKGLLDAVGSSLKPQVHCLSQLANTGSGSPDFGLFSSDQLQKGEPRPGQLPSRGVIEMKAVNDDSLFTSEPKQITKYFDYYRLVIVTNLRSFQIIGEDPSGNAVRLERFTLADTPAEFWSLIQTPGSSSQKVGNSFGEFLSRALTQSVSLHRPKDVAWFLASYARDARHRVEAAGDLPALATVRAALEEALGIEFQAKQGDHFFRSTLVQTLFYGLFSAWVLWARTGPKGGKSFDWRASTWYLNVPFVRTLFQQLSSPMQLEPLGITEVLDWAGDTLNRISPEQFLKSFDSGEAIQFFYEPFLEAFDPELRKQFGVWYTPTEIVRYMVAQVDHALKVDLKIEDGLAADNVFILDPCCGTGGFITAALERIHQNLSSHGLGDAIGGLVRDAAQHRVFGFEIMPAPFVVAHLQVGLALSRLEADLEDGQRPGIYLTNALTGWEPHTSKPLPFPELEAERASADAIKQKAPILVILGNPPYDGFSGVAPGDEERSLSTEYRKFKKVEAPQGKGLNEPYVRFFRMAERRITEKTGAGIICFISNYSWLDGLSHTGMRERFLEVFDAVRIDNLHGDRKASERAPDGKSSATVFAVRGQSPGIKVGTAISTLVRLPDHAPRQTIEYRDFDASNADERRASLLASLDNPELYPYEVLTPSLPLKLNFMKGAVAAGYADWPRLPELMPSCFAGIQTARDEFLVSIDRPSLEQRMDRYFDPGVSDDDLSKAHPEVMGVTKRYDPYEIRKMLRNRGRQGGDLARYAYRPFDVRWLYWDRDTKLLDEKREEFLPHVSQGNVIISAQQKARGEWHGAQAGTSLACLDLLDRGSSNFPTWLHDPVTKAVRPNLNASLEKWLSDRGIPLDAVALHVVATLHSPAYASSNGGALRSDWPRIPLPSSQEVFKNSATYGLTLAQLLDVEVAVAGVTAGALFEGLPLIAVPRGKDYHLRAWGYRQKSRGGSNIVMPGQGNIKRRSWNAQEQDALSALAKRHGLTLDHVLDLLGKEAIDVHLNDDAYWQGVPPAVWGYELGGYPVLRKWLSYRDETVLGRALEASEVLHFSGVVRRITELLLHGPALDHIHDECRSAAIGWRDGRPTADADPTGSASDESLSPVPA
ncbi:type ISP restriction/modification enzyme [Phenylobacterium sp.]|uniref:type ISP restriction/modification enzyme n=1 Tax=Phenylobacterium sp. TaxID=1871053 RepID=UPI002F4144FC